MPKYFYIAKTLKGECQSGSREAKDQHELARILHEEGLILISASLEKEIKERKFEIDIPGITGVSLIEKIMFTRNLQVMLASGVDLPRALEMLTFQAKSRKFKEVLSQMTEEAIKGKSLSESLAKYPNIFSELFQNMVKVGEEAGRLDEVLKNLTLQMEREHELKSRIKGAMIYPAVIVCAMVGIGILMMVMVVPKLAEIFQELQVELPLTTRLVIGVGTFLAKKWYFIPLVIFAFWLFLRTILKTKVGKKVMDGFFLKLPIISPIVRKTSAAFTVRTLASLIASGVPIVRSLEITSTTLGNFYFRQAISQIAEEVRKGRKLSDALRPYENLYPPLVMQMVAVGEETGETPAILTKLADFFEEEVTNITRNLAKVIEPLLIIIIGAAIGFFVISIIQPIYGMLLWKPL